MKIAVCLLAVISCAVALPAEVSLETAGELDLSKLKPINLYLEPENPVDTESVDLPGSRIIGGTEVTPNSVPHQAAVIINGGSFCGGSLISNNHVLTAAHCTISASTIEIRLGAHYFNQNEATQIRVTSTSVVNHENYNQGSFAANDIAVVFLPAPITQNAQIQVIPLATADAGTFEGATAVLAGWGRTSASSNAISQVLNSVTLQVMSNAACQSIFGNAVVASSICTSGAGTVGACNGDSGGALVVNGVQVGIVSFGSANCEAGNPSVYARITSFRNWVTQNAGI